MNRDYEIVHVTADMMDEIEIIERTCFTSPWSRNSLESEAFAPYGCWFAAVKGCDVCGFIGTHVLGDEGEIINVAVLPEHRRHGLARAMIEKYLAENPELSQVFLEVRQNNFPARTLYSSIGFEEYNIRRNYYENPVEDAILMRLAPKER